MAPTDILEHIQTRTWRMPLPPHPVAAPQARRLCEMALTDWELYALQDTAGLIVSELVTNALKYNEVFDFSLHREGDLGVLIEVTDRSLGVPKVKELTETEVTGRGMYLVDVLAFAWGVRSEEDGRKTVWARIWK